jgi:hypothetical protein
MLSENYEYMVLLISPDNKIILRIPCRTAERCYELIKAEIPLHYNMLITNEEFNRGVREFNYTNIAYFKDANRGYRIGLFRKQC